MTEIPTPSHFDPSTVGSVWKVDYAARAAEARDWAESRAVTPAAGDRIRVCLVLIDCQNTFCIPGYELFVGGQSGTGAVEDNSRLCRFIYSNLSTITEVVATMDTHRVLQIFHPVFWVDDRGNHPVGGATVITPEDVETGGWSVNPEVARSLTGDPHGLDTYALHYVRRLAARYPLMIWPYHAMLGGIGHALVAAIEEAVFFHSVARRVQARFEIKGDNPLTENYSVLSPEVLDGPDGEQIAGKNSALLQRLLDFDAVIVAGQAKSHCVAWTVSDLLDEIEAHDRALAGKVYLLEDCTSPVVVPGVIDFTDPAEEAFRRFAEAGMHVVRSTEPVVSWDGFPGAAG